MKDFQVACHVLGGRASFRQCGLGCGRLLFMAADGEAVVQISRGGRHKQYGKRANAALYMLIVSKNRRGFSGSFLRMQAT